MKDHIADRAGFLAALSAEDPERKLAEDHARGCPGCREALEEGHQLVALLQRARPPAAAPALEAPRLGMAARQVAWVATGGVAVAWLFQLMVGSGFVITARSVVVSLAVLAVALGVVTFLRERGRLAVTAVVATSGLFAYLSGTAAGFDPGIGIRCAFRELWAAAIAWGIVVLVARRAGVSFGRWNAAAVAAAGALAAHAGQHLACEVPHSDAHLMIFHFGAVVLAALVGAAAAERRGPQTA